MATRSICCALVAGAILAACGTPSKDLFVVERDGAIAGARLRMLASDGGLVTCNGSTSRPMGSDRLLRARELARLLGELAQRPASRPPAPGGVFTYRIRVEQGTIDFGDTSPGLPAPLLRIQGFTRELAKDVCGLPR